MAVRGSNRATETELSAAAFARSVRFNRPPRNAAFSLFAVMRNERYFLPAFFAHYRALGVQQFVIVDDASDDGTTEFLAAQPDCCSGISPHRYGARIRLSDPDYNGLAGRAGPIFKRVMPQHFLSGQYVLCADADEFLLLPDACPSLPETVALLAARGWKSVAASLVDFYPATLAGLAEAAPPADAAELFRRYGYFDATAFLRLSPGQQPQRCGPTVADRLFRLCGIREAPPVLAGLPSWLQARLPLPVPRSAWFKTPLILHDGRTWLDGAHEANVPPPDAMLLAMAHFKFNADTYRKIASALTLRSYARGSRKYEHFEDMLQVMHQRQLGFLGPASVAYRHPDQLLAAGLMLLPADVRRPPAAARGRPHASAAA